MSLRCRLILPGLISVLFVVGCGGEPAEELVPVGGTLLVDGEPLDGVSVIFHPVDGENNRGGYGTTDSTGAFNVTHFVQKEPGLPPGKYSITYSRMRLPDGSAAPPLEPGEPPDPENIQVETLPESLTLGDSNRQVEIPPGGNSNLELEISMEANPMINPG